MFKWLRNHIQARPRRIDVTTLWPIIKRQASERTNSHDDLLRVARLAFALHAKHDPAWQALDDKERHKQINALV